MDFPCKECHHFTLRIKDDKHRITIRCDNCSNEIIPDKIFSGNNRCRYCKCNLLLITSHEDKIIVLCFRCGIKLS